MNTLFYVKMQWLQLKMTLMRYSAYLELLREIDSSNSFVYVLFISIFKASVYNEKRKKILNFQTSLNFDKILKGIKYSNLTLRKANFALD